MPKKVSPLTAEEMTELRALVQRVVDEPGPLPDTSSADVARALSDPNHNTFTSRVGMAIVGRHCHAPLAEKTPPAIRRTRHQAHIATDVTVTAAMMLRG